MNNNNGSSKADRGISYLNAVGCSVAAVISYCAWHSVMWAILHGFLGWFYIVYYVIKYGLTLPTGM